MEKKAISRDGFENLRRELTNLKEIERPELLRVIEWARSLGDLSENADYSAAKEKQRIMDRRIRFLEETIENSNVIDIKSLSGDRVMFGAQITAEDEDGNVLKCQILSDIEADGKNIIACTSPVGRAFIGKCKGDSCIVSLPSGSREYEIIDVKY